MVGTCYVSAIQCPSVYWSSHRRKIVKFFVKKFIHRGGNQCTNYKKYCCFGVASICVIKPALLKKTLCYSAKVTVSYRLFINLVIIKFSLS